MVVLHHQGETAPGEVGAYILLTHHHTHTVAYAVGTGWECKILPLAKQLLLLLCGMSKHFCSLLIQYGVILCPNESLSGNCKQLFAL